nr:MAG TPA: CW7 repeat protein [Caudoviricetes sp.]
MTVTAINLPDTVSVALLVIAGQFGNGDDRKQKLTKAGYNPVTVQSCVNELLPILNKYGG